MLDHGIEQSFQLVETSEGSKCRRAFLDEELAGRTGFDFLQTSQEVVARHLERPQLGRRGAVGLEWGGGEEAAQGNHADFLAERFEIGADEAVRMLGDFLEVDVGRERHGARVDLEDLEPRLCIGDTDFDFPIEAPGTSQSRVEDLRDIGGTDDDDLAARHEAIHQAQQLRHDAFFDLPDHFGAFGSHGVDLVDKQDRRRVTRCFLEHLAELGLTLAIELPHDLGAIEVNEMHAALGRHSAGQQGLTGARRAVQQHTFGREDAQPLEDARVLQRELDDLAHSGHLTLEPADIFVRHRGSAGRRLLAFHHPDVGAFPDHDRARRNRPHDLEVDRLGKRRHTDHATRDDRHAGQVFEHPVGRDDGRRRPYPQRREAHCDGLGVLDWSDRHLFLQPRATIAAGRAVDLDHALASLVGQLGACDGDRAAGDLQHVADPGADAHQVGRCQPRDGMPDVLDARFRDAQCESRGERR